MHSFRLRDPRYFQLCFQLVLLIFGCVVLNWPVHLMHFAIYTGAGLAFFLLSEFLYQQVQPSSTRYWQRIQGGLLSVIITSFSLCLLLRVNHTTTALLAAFLSVVPKYVIRFKGRHVFNPSALAIVGTILISRDAWFSPGQWGSTAMIVFLVALLGSIILLRVQRLGVSLAFFSAFILLLFSRQILYLGWPLDYFLQSVSNGSLLLFGFFMITDPKTIPSNAKAAACWAILVAVGAFYLLSFRFIPGALVWTLVLLQPLVPLINHFVPGPEFQWQPNPSSKWQFS